MSKYDRAAGKALGVVVAIIITLVFSWLVTCGIIKLITLCFGLNFKCGISTGIWLIILLLKGIFGGNSSK